MRWAALALAQTSRWDGRAARATYAGRAYEVDACGCVFLARCRDSPLRANQHPMREYDAAATQVRWCAVHRRCAHDSDTMWRHSCRQCQHERAQRWLAADRASAAALGVVLLRVLGPGATATFRATTRFFAGATRT